MTHLGKLLGPSLAKATKCGRVAGRVTGRSASAVFDQANHPVGHWHRMHAQQQPHPRDPRAA
eukprot:51301-Chlamydomonas_euryale.AAC.2